MVNHIKDTNMDPEVVALIREVFLLNSIPYNETDYAVVKVEDILFSEVETPNNSFLFLAPNTTNSDLPILKLPYKRKNIEEVLSVYNPTFTEASEQSTVKGLIDQINESLTGSITIKKQDFYDTYIVTDNGSYYVVLFSHPSSLFYVGNTKINQKPINGAYRLFFDVSLTPK